MLLVTTIISLLMVSVKSACTPSFLRSMTSSNVSSNNTILQNLQALADMGGCSNSSVTYVNLLLALNSSCTSDISEQLNSTDRNYTFFAPSDSAFKLIPGFPDFGSSFCELCNATSSSMNNSADSYGSCPVGCNSTSVGFNATSADLMPCLSQLLQYHLLNESLSFNDTRFGFMNRSSFNFTVIPTELNSTCLVNLSNPTSANGTENYQVLVFNVTNSASGNDSLIGDVNGGKQSSMNSSAPFNVTILHGINAAANVTVFDIQSSNGILHIVDALLIPPANFTQTLNYTYSNRNGRNNTMRTGMLDMNPTLPSFLNETDLDSIANMTGITVFLPDPLTLPQDGSNISISDYNLTNFVFPSVLYNNRSFVSIGNLSEGVFIQQNLTNMNGENVTVLFGRNNAMVVNGSRVTESNILMKNGVMHLLNASDLVPPSSAGNETGGIFARILNKYF